MCRVLGVLQNSLYVLYGLEGVTDVKEIPGTVPDTLQKFCKIRVLYRQSYRSFCTNTRGYCVKVVQIPGGIVLEVLQNLHKVRVLY